MEIFTTFSSWLLAVILVYFMYISFIYAIRANKSFAGYPKLPPNPPKLPIIGNLHQLLGKHRYQDLWQLSLKYGPVMLLHIGTKPFLVISSPAMAKEVLKTQDHVFCSRPKYQATKRMTYNFLDVGFSPYSNHWKKMRKLFVVELLGPKRARSFNNVLVTEMERTVGSLKLNPSNTVVNLNKVFLATIKGVVCKMAFGTNYRQEPPKGPSWEVLLEECLTMLNGSYSDNFPWFGKVFDRVCGWSAKLETFFDNLDAYFQTIIDEHYNDITQEIISEDDKDFVHTLIELSLKDNTSDSSFTIENVKALIMDVFAGGVHTTVTMLVWTMSEIARNSRVKQKVQAEIRNCSGRIQNVNELDTTKMRYLKMVVKETLRLHPAAPLLIPHESLSHCQLGGYDVSPGTGVLVNAWGIGRDPRTWGENATEFYPERFEDIDVGYVAGNCEMVPFGGGRRTCPGMNMAPATIEFVIANLLYWFDWEIPGGVHNQDLDMQEQGALIFSKKLPLFLVPTNHNWED